MNNKTIMITGANSGIGLRAAEGLAKQGHTVVMVCRNQARGESARQQVIKASGNQTVDLIIGDLSSQQSIHQAVETFNNRHTHLDVLINNAANFDLTQKTVTLTDDGYEAIFATNHLGSFLLTNLLLDTLKASPSARIINIASKGLLAYPFLKIDFNNLDGQKKYSPTWAYYHSKLAQIIFTLDLAQKFAGTGVTANVIRVPAVRLDAGRYDNVPAFLQAVYRLKMRFALTAEAMAQAYIRMATDPGFEGVTGQYVDENCKSVGIPGGARDKQVWEQLWQISSERTKLAKTDYIYSQIPT